MISIGDDIKFKSNNFISVIFCEATAIYDIIMAIILSNKVKKPDESDANSIQMNDIDNDQISAYSKTKTQRSSRSGRRAAQKANEHMALKDAAPKKRREKFNLELFPLPGETNKPKRIKAFNRRSSDSKDVEKDP